MTITELWRRGIRVLAHDGQLKVQATREPISRELLERVRRNKSDLIREMLQPDAVAPHEPRCCTCHSWEPDVPMGRCSEHGFDAEHDDNCRHHSNWEQPQLQPSCPDPQATPITADPERSKHGKPNPEPDASRSMP